MLVLVGKAGDNQSSYSQFMKLKAVTFSAKEKTEKKMFGFSFIKLVNEYGNTVRDGPHELYVYKVSFVQI